MIVPGPMSPAEIKTTMANTQRSIDNHGLWNKVCNRCNQSVGGRLAEYGKPTDEELTWLACPGCGNAGEKGPGFRVEFLPSERTPMTVDQTQPRTPEEVDHLVAKFKPIPQLGETEDLFVFYAAESDCYLPDAVNSMRSNGVPLFLFKHLATTLDHPETSFIRGYRTEAEAVTAMKNAGQKLKEELAAAIKAVDHPAAVTEDKA